MYSPQSVTHRAGSLDVDEHGPFCFRIIGSIKLGPGLVSQTGSRTGRDKDGGRKGTAHQPTPIVHRSRLASTCHLLPCPTIVDLQYLQCQECLVPASLELHLKCQDCC